jgi:hypothetical protein
LAALVAAALFLAVLFFAWHRKWQATIAAMGRRHGRLLLARFHSIEHLVQWFQYHALN